MRPFKLAIFVRYPIAFPETFKQLINCLSIYCLLSRKFRTVSNPDIYFRLYKNAKSKNNAI